MRRSCKNMYVHECILFQYLSRFNTLTVYYLFMYIVNEKICHNIISSTFLTITYGQTYFV